MAETTYTTIQGDTWDIAAYKALGSELLMTELMQKNPRHLDTVIFEAGVRLALPDVKTAAAVSRPPWSR